MKNNFYVGNFTLNYISDKLTLTGGGNLTSYQGDHYGKLLWVKYNKNISDKYEWYRGDADKKEFSVFGKITYNILDNLAIFGDMQYRYIDYRMSGIDDDLENITNKNYYSFFNPKAGLSYSFNNNEVYASLSISNREPLRTDIKESVKGGSTQKFNPKECSIMNWAIDTLQR